MADATLKAVITAEDRASKVISGVGSSVDKTRSKLDSLKPVFTAAAAASAVAGVAFLAFGKKALSAAADFEQTTVSFTTMLGSGEKAGKFLKDLTQFAKVTPFELKGLEESSKQLLAYGFAQEEVLPNLKALGDIAAGVGMDKLPNLILAFGQVKAATHLTGMELRQFTEAGVPLLDQLSKQLKKPVSAIQEMVSAGEIGFPEVEKALKALSSEGGRFNNLMEKQSHTFSGMMSNMKDSAEIFMRAVGQRILPVAKTVLEAVSNLNLGDKFLAALDAASKGFDTLRTAAQNLLNQIRPYLSSAFDEVRETLSRLSVMWLETTSRIRDFATEVIKSGAVKNIIQALKASFDEIWAAVKLRLWPSLQELGAVIRDQLWPEIVSLWNALQPLKPFFELLAKVIGGVLLVTLMAVLRVISNTIVGLVELTEMIVHFGTVIIKNSKPVIDTFIKTIGGVISSFKDIVNWVDKAIGKINEFTSKVGKVNLNPFSKDFNVPFLTHHASGGSVSPLGPSIVGERGPELFVPSTYGTIIPSNRLGGGISITITGNSFMGREGIAEQIGNELMRQLKLNVRV